MNSNQLIDNAEALRLFFNDDVYLAGDMSPMEKQVKEAIKSPAIESLESKETVVAQPNVYQQEPVAALPKVEEPAATYNQRFEFKHLGKNEKGILILVNDAQNPVSTPQGTELLRKLVLSINLKNADFELVNYSAYTSAKFEHFTSFFTCKLMFSFGVLPTALGLGEMSLHQLNLFNDIRLIFTHNLHDLDADLVAKKALWGTLKNLTI